MEPKPTPDFDVLPLKKTSPRLIELVVLPIHQGLPCPSRHESHISGCLIQSRLQRVGLRMMTTVVSPFLWDETLWCHWRKVIA